MPAEFSRLHLNTYREEKKFNARAMFFVFVLLALFAVFTGLLLFTLLDFLLFPNARMKAPDSKGPDYKDRD